MTLKSIVQNISSVFHSAEAEKVWRRGCPVAKSPLEATKSWGPYIPTWTTLIRKDLLYNTLEKGAQNRHHMAWIREPGFWNTFWDALAKTPKWGDSTLLQTYLEPYVTEASRIGNSIFFDQIPLSQKIEVNELLLTQGTLIHPSLLKHSILTAPKSDLVVQMNSIRTRQQLHWVTDLEPLFAYDISLEEALSYLGGILGSETFDKKTQINILGHFVVNAPQSWRRPELLDSIHQRFQTPKNLLEPINLIDPSIDLKLIGLCSGYGPNDNGTLKGIKNVAKHLVQRRSLMHITPTDPIIQVLTSLYSFTTPLDLYDSIDNMNILKGAMPSFDIGALNLD